MKKKEVKLLFPHNGGFSSTTPNSIQNSPINTRKPYQHIDLCIGAGVGNKNDVDNGSKDLSKRIESIKAKYKSIMLSQKDISPISPKQVKTPLQGNSPVLNGNQHPTVPLNNNYFCKLIENNQKSEVDSNKKMSKGPVSRKDITSSVKDYIKKEFMKGVSQIGTNDKNNIQQEKPIISISAKISVTPNFRSKCSTPVHAQPNPPTEKEKETKAHHKKNSIDSGNNGIQILIETKINSGEGNKNIRASTISTQSTESHFKINDSILDRDRLIKYNKIYCKTHNDIPPTTIDHYKLIKLIGKGAFGKVSLGIHKLTGKYVAIKSIEKAVMKDDYQKRKVMREIYIMKRVSHSNIISLLEVFESTHHLLLVMEYSDGGDLLQYVKRKGGLIESEAKKIFKQIVYGVAHIHCRNVLHRDIKLDNILMDSMGGIKICDFGVSKVITPDMLIREQCGTPAYIAPEIISMDGYSGFSADIWSMGVLLYTMISSNVPFKAGTMSDLKELIGSGDFLYPNNSSANLKNLLKGLLTVNPQNRISIPEILQHPWLKAPSYIDEVKYRKRDLEYEKGELVEKLNIRNIFPKHRDAFITKDDYFYIINEDYNRNIDEEALVVMKSLGYRREYVISTINSGIVNHATATYRLIVAN